MSFLFGIESGEIIQRLWEKRLTLLEGPAGLAKANATLDFLIYHPTQETALSLISDEQALLSLQQTLTTEGIVFQNRFENCSVDVLLKIHCPKALPLVQETKALIEKVCPNLNIGLEALLRWLVPIRQRDERPTKRRLLTHAQYPLILFLSLAERCQPWSLQKGIEKVALAIDILHEFGHQLLYLILHADAVVLKEDPRGIYSPIRRTRRPAVLAFHAAIANGFMIDFCDHFLRSRIGSPAENGYVTRSYNELSAQQELGLREIRKDTLLTSTGYFLLHELEAQLSTSHTNFKELPSQDFNDTRGYFTFSYA